MWPFSALDKKLFSLIIAYAFPLLKATGGFSSG